jgi:hypothetical protein
VTRHVTLMTIDDAEHYTAEQRAAIIASYPAHERDARAKGIPVLGSGRVFPVAEEDITCEPFPIPEHWPRIIGVDFGWDHPFGATDCAWDRDADCFYVCKEYAQREATPIIHAAAIRAWDVGAWAPVAWPHDGLQHDKGSGEDLAEQYRGQHLKMCDERATFEDGGNGLEAGIAEMLTRMQTNRWRVFSTCGAWLAEFRLYHRKDGLIVKLKDDLISSSRYAMMMRRYAKAKPRPRPRTDQPSGPNSWMGR